MVDLDRVKRWRCTICGEIVTTDGGQPEENFECPVCKASGDVWEPVIDEATPSSTAADEVSEVFSGHVVIIGAGVSGCYAAYRILRESPAAHVTLLGSEERRLYNRTQISKQLVTMDRNAAPMPDLSPENDESFWDNERLDLRLGPQGRVYSVNYSAHTVRVGENGGDDAEIAWDRLIFATGASATLPGISGFQRAVANGSAFTLRTEADIRAVIDRFHGVADAYPNQRIRLVFIGAGLLSIEAATDVLRSPFAKKPGVDIWFLERSPQFLTAVGADVASAVRTELTAMARGVNGILEIVTNVTVDDISVCSAVEGPFPPMLIAARVGDSVSSFPADIIIIGAGVTPNTQLAAAAGFSVLPFGIAVDSDLRCSQECGSGIECPKIDDVFAVGDCACINGVRPAYNWAESIAHAERAAAVLCGAPPQRIPQLPGALSFWVRLGAVTQVSLFLRDTYTGLASTSVTQSCALRTVLYGRTSSEVRAAAQVSFCEDGRVLSASCAQPDEHNERLSSEVGMRLAHIISQATPGQYRVVADLFKTLCCQS